MGDPTRIPAPASEPAPEPTPPPSSSTTTLPPSSFSSTSTSGHDVITVWPPQNPTPQREQQRRQLSSPSSPEKPRRAHEPHFQRGPSSLLPPILPLPPHPVPPVGRVLPPATPVNRRGPVSASDVFFRTRICKRFVIEGSCGYGDSCSFAHSREELRSAAGNWQDIVAAGGGKKLCKIFLRGDPCPYGERCSFLHVDAQVAAAAEGGRGYGNGGSLGPWRHRKDDVGGFREINQNPGTWKTKSCYSWEATGHCPYGDACAYAHGHAELKKLAGKSELDHNEDVYMVSSKPPAHADVAVGVETAAHTKKKGFLKWEDKKKLVRIYGDWIDDLDK